MLFFMHFFKNKKSLLFEAVAKCTPMRSLFNTQLPSPPPFGGASPKGEGFNVDLNFHLLFSRKYARI